MKFYHSRNLKIRANKKGRVGTLLRRGWQNNMQNNFNRSIEETRSLKKHRKSNNTPKFFWKTSDKFKRLLMSKRKNSKNSKKCITSNWLGLYYHYSKSQN